MTTHASGSFEVEITPQSDDTADGTTLGRMLLDKQFHGDLEATGKGEMLTASMESGAAVYVAIERVRGTLHGRSGSFVLRHNGTAVGEAQQLTIGVVPESGTGELTGLAGNMVINIVEGKHLYEFEYTLGE